MIYAALLKHINKTQGERLFGAYHDKVISAAIDEGQKPDNVISFDVFARVSTRAHVRVRPSRLKELSYHTLKNCRFARLLGYKGGDSNALKLKVRFAR